jgi:excisionase family DNA binding protein
MPKSTSHVPACLTVGEFAERISVSEKTIRRAVDAGELRVHRVGRLIRIADEDAAIYMAMRRH